MAYIGCQDGSIRCMVPSGKDIELENYIICKPHSDCVKKVSEWMKSNRIDHYW